MDISIKTLLVDDEKAAIENLYLLLGNYSPIKIVGSFTQFHEALTFIKNNNFDLIFLDIEIQSRSGFELAKEIALKNPLPSIVFVTAFNKYAIEAIRHAAFEYLLKPIDPVELSNAMARFLERAKPQNLSLKLETLLEKLDNQNKIRFNTRTGYLLINPVDVVYCEADGNYTTFVMRGNRKELVCCKIGDIIDKLPSNFIRAGRSVILNQDFLSKVERVHKKVELVIGNEKYIVTAKLEG